MLTSYSKVLQKSVILCLTSLVSIPPVVYGITTGFGKFARTVIPVSKLK